MRKLKIRSWTTDVAIWMVTGLVGLVTVYPFWDTLVVSFMSLEEYLGSPVHLWPHRPTAGTYRYILGMTELWQSYAMTLRVTVVGTLINLAVSTMTAWPLSRPGLRGKRLMMFLIVFTMMFSGGLIPLYIVVLRLGIMNTMWALILPGAVATYNLIIMRTFFSTLPASLEESARIDGADDFTILARIIVPLSMPVIATISLFYAVAHWNGYLNAVMYISDARRWTLQLYLRAMLYENEAAISGGATDNAFLIGQPIKMATVIVAMAPVMIIYPFFQRWFTKGVLLGAVKG